jgi:hypothetical protein
MQSWLQARQEQGVTVEISDFVSFAGAGTPGMCA